MARDICIFTGSGFSKALFNESTQSEFIKEFIKPGTDYFKYIKDYKDELEKVNDIEMLFSHYHNLAYSGLSNDKIRYKHRIISLRCSILLHYRERSKSRNFNCYEKCYKSSLTNFFDKEKINKDNVFFVTTNYDMSIEKIIADGCIPEDKDKIYYYPETLLFDSGSASNNAIPIFKMHGSINWLEKRYYENCEIRGIRPLKIRTELYEKLNINNCITDVLTLKSDNEIYTPILIPFFFQKESWLGERWHCLFESTWSTAKEFIKNCKTIYFIGYSLPAADHYMFSFLYNILKYNAKIEKIKIINPDKEIILTKLIDIIGHSNVDAHEKKFDNYLEEFC